MHLQDELAVQQSTTRLVHSIEITSLKSDTFNYAVSLAFIPTAKSPTLSSDIRLQRQRNHEMIGRNWYTLA